MTPAPREWALIPRSGDLASAPWFHENWTREILDQIERSFDSSCERWRSLYRAAIRQRELHHKIIGDHARPQIERDHSRRLRAQAESQIRLLTEAEGIYEGCALQAHGIQLSEMAAAVKLSQRLLTESCVVTGNGHYEA